MIRKLMKTHLLFRRIFSVFALLALGFVLSASLFALTESVTCLVAIAEDPLSPSPTPTSDYTGGAFDPSKATGASDSLSDITKSLTTALQYVGDVLMILGIWRFAVAFQSDRVQEWSQGVSAIVVGFALANLDVLTNLFSGKSGIEANMDELVTWAENILFYIGLILVVGGIIAYAFAQTRDDASGQGSGIRFIVSGLVLTSAGSIIKMFDGADLNSGMNSFLNTLLEMIFYVGLAIVVGGIIAYAFAQTRDDANAQGGAIRFIVVGLILASAGYVIGRIYGAAK